MEIPYNVKPRPDTGLYNAKLGIWLFLASEVMLFGGLFSAYIFLRMGADPGYWPHGLLNVPVGMGNTFVLIFSSVTVVFAWAMLKLRNWKMYRVFMALTILCGIGFLGVKLCIEWPAKFDHFGAYIKKESASKYEAYLGNEFAAEQGLEPRVELTGHLLYAPEKGRYSRYAAKAKQNLEHFEHSHHGVKVEVKNPESLVLQLDAIYADPTNVANEHPVFWPRPLSDKVTEVDLADVSFASTFAPRHSSYFSSYFLITGLHGLHVLGGVIVFVYFFFSKKLYDKDPEHLTNRIEVAGLFWHFVDLVWIFVFPIFYLL